MRSQPVRLGLASAIAALAAGCGGHHAAQLGFADCVKAWNAPDNVRRARAVYVVREGYVRPGIQLSVSGGRPVGPQPVNPVGCRVIFFKQDRWIAFVARRHDDTFRFRPAMLGAEEGDQRGIWPDATHRGPNNARLLAGAGLALTSASRR